MKSTIPRRLSSQSMVKGLTPKRQLSTASASLHSTEEPGTTFKVTAANGIGSGNASNEVTSFTTAGPGAPTNVAADPGTRADSEVTLTWAAPR